MKYLFYTLLLFSGIAHSQTCTQIIYPNTQQGNVHVYANSTVTDSAGSNYYVCSGVTLTVTYSAGCNYQLEENASLVIMDHEGDNVFAKGNCSIIDYSTTTIVVTLEATSTFSKPNDPFNYVMFNCSPTIFDYSLVGGSSPCSADVNDQSRNQILSPFPNPVTKDGVIEINVDGEYAELFDFAGKKLGLFIMDNSRLIELNGAKEGVYILVVTLRNGQQMASRIVVQ